MSHNNIPITRFTAGEGRIFQPKTFKQNQLSIPKWINEYKQNNKPLQVHEMPNVDRLKNGRISISFPKETKPVYPCERCQIEGRHPMSYSPMPWRSCSARFIGVINVLETGEESLRRVSDDYAAVKWIIQKTYPIEFGPIKKAINWSNINTSEQNKALE